MHRIYKREFAILHGDTQKEVEDLRDAAVKAITEAGGAIEQQSEIVRIDEDPPSFVMNIDYAVMKETF